MSSTVRAAFSGSSGSSQPRGLPVSTAQNRQARVQTAPISISVAVPAFQHSPMFGQCDSSQTVRAMVGTILRTSSNLAPPAIFARNQRGFGRCAGPRLQPFLMPSRIAVKSGGVRYFCAALHGLALSWTGIPLKSVT